jgi:tetratricopeptide (TPR) repeat protein
MILPSIKSSWFLGRGIKAFNNGYYDKALRYFLSGLENAKKTDDDIEIAGQMEAIAETYFELENYDRARLYANEALEIFKKYLPADTRGAFKKSVNNLNKLLDDIRNKEEEKSQSEV